MNFMDLRATYMILTDLKFVELEHLPGKIRSGAVFLGSEATSGYTNIKVVGVSTEMKAADDTTERFYVDGGA